LPGSVLNPRDKGVEQFAYLLRGVLGHDDDFSNPATPNQFGKRRIDAKCPSRDSEICSNRTASRLVFELGNPRFANYVSAKGAHLGLTRSWARELAPTGITVNLVAPGWIPTERHADATQEELDSYTANVPMKRMGSAEDVAKIVAFLASDAARFITGQRFSVNGGNTLA
jgi:NAD(P)-dependent dehydrogenase (short-subunit alcohol dehydrogenase family)